MFDPSFYSVKCISIIDRRGNILVGKYYDGKLFPTLEVRNAFKAKLLKMEFCEKNSVAIINKMIVVYRSSNDVVFSVAGDQFENEMVLSSVLDCLVQRFNKFLQGSISSNAVRENYAEALFTVDQICDGGIILETDYVKLESPTFSADSLNLKEVVTKVFGVYRQ